MANVLSTEDSTSPERAESDKQWEQRERKILVDSGASAHLFRDRSAFSSSYEELAQPIEVSLGDNHIVPAVGVAM